MTTNTGVIKTKIGKKGTYELAKGLSEYIVYLRSNNESNNEEFLPDLELYHSNNENDANKYFENLE